MARSHRKGKKHLTSHKNPKFKLKKKTERKGIIRSENKAVDLSSTVSANSVSAVTDISAQQRKIRAKSIQRIQKGERLKQHWKNRNLPEFEVNARKKDDIFLGNRNVVSLEADFRSDKRTEVSKSYYREFKKVVEAADVILEVLDARDPLGSRCVQVEQAVLSSGSNKRLVLVLNKIDLIPRDNLEKWLKYLRQEFPTVAFKASTQSQSKNLSHAKVAAVHINEKLQSSRCCVGANFLMKLLGNYCRNQNILTAIRVGVVGFPNVGKSSIINSLKRARACTVGATPGVTKSMQEVILDKHIRLLDSPGVVFSKEGSSLALALRNALKVETLSDVITPAEVIISRADKNQLMSYYSIPEYSTSEELLSLLAQKMGRFKKGGIPDPEAAARKLLNDWNTGKIKYYTHPPEVYQPSCHISAELVQEMGKAFDISALEEEMEFDNVSHITVHDSVGIQSDDKLYNQDKELEMDIDKNNAEQNKISVKLGSKAENNACEKKEVFVPLDMQQNRLRKKAFKQMKKKRKRTEKAATVLSETMDSLLKLL